MLTKIQYHTYEERKKLIDDNDTSYLVEEHNLVEGNFLIFSDVPLLPRPISVPEAFFEAIKEENAELKATNAGIQEAILALMDLAMV